MHASSDKKRIAILRIISQSPAAIGTGEVAGRLSAEGWEANERTVRHHLRRLEQDGLLCREKGRRRLTDLGLRELEVTGVAGRVGQVITRIDELAWATSFDPEARRGSVAVDLVLVPRPLATTAASLALPGFLAGGGPAAMVGWFPAGETVGNFTVPRDTVALAAVSLVTLVSVFIGRGIPLSIRFGGILETEAAEPSRFLEVIDYRETSVDPLGLFLQSGMIDAGEFPLRGSARIAATFAEAPAVSQPEIMRLSGLTREAGLGGVLSICPPDRQTVGIHVPPARIGVIIGSNLNPFSALGHAAIGFKTHPIAGAVPYSRLFPYYELVDRLASGR